MNNELERIWKETAVALSKYYTGICLERLRKLQRNLSIRCPGLESNRGPSEYLSVLLLR
jgi:hypothetical protein